jgi:hypothetical protein
MNMRNLLAASLFCGIAFTLSAQQPVAPPPKPANDAPANAEVLKLLRAGMSENVVLNKIRATTDKFDTSADALVALKQAGANDAELNAMLAQGSAPAEQPPAAAPVDNGPSLAETMQFIQEKLNGLGMVTYKEDFQSSSPWRTYTSTKTETKENISVVSDPNQCQITYHQKATVDGNPIWDNNYVIVLRDVTEIVVESEKQHFGTSNLGNDLSMVVISTTPPMTVLVVRRPHDEENTFYFIDADLADRVARAMQHAVELCGDGNKDKF